MVQKRVIEIIDGDTVKFSDGILGRLANIDAPEKGRRGFDETKRELARILQISNYYVDSETVSKDKYGRDVVKLQNSQGDVNQRMGDFIRENNY